MLMTIYSKIVLCKNIKIHTQYTSSVELNNYLIYNAIHILKNKIQEQVNYFNRI